MPIHGKSMIGHIPASASGDVVTSIDPSNNTTLNNFYIATPGEVDEAVEKASRAFYMYRRLPGRQKASFLEAIAGQILGLGDELIEIASKESGLPKARIEGERGRTVGQLRMFAELVKEGSWVEAVIDTALPSRQPLPRPDIRKMLVPVGPVVVFTASNFPLAFSTAGGDTAAALAAGNPVIVKAHNSHLGTNELVAGAIIRAAEQTHMPDGVFSSLNCRGFEVGQRLVAHPKVKAVAFTGSPSGGMALYRAASQRSEPIPVFAEMGSTNPVVILPGKLNEKAGEVAQQYAGSITLGAGQFCTKPGLILGMEGDGMDRFGKKLAEEIEKIMPSTMLNGGIHQNFTGLREKALAQKGVSLLAATPGNRGGSNLSTNTVAITRGENFVTNEVLHEEVFGPFSLIVVCKDKKELKAVLSSVQGQLTTTIIAEEYELDEYAELIDQAKSMAGRVLFNGVPTGVEVGHAMQHGGPYPASTDSRFTSVGSDSIKRFVRPLAFQSFPEEALPDELKDSNPLGIWRKVNGQWVKARLE